MATELELALFEQELDAMSDVPESKRWQLERDATVPLGLHVVMHPMSHPEEFYKVRVHWADYFGPFSMKFIHLETSVDNDPNAWPKCFGFRPNSLDACLPWTAEGHGLHPEWRNSATNRFPTVDLPMQYALLQIQLSLDTTYEGRGSR